MVRMVVRPQHQVAGIAHYSEAILSSLNVDRRNPLADGGVDLRWDPWRLSNGVSLLVLQQHTGRSVAVLHWP